MVPLVHSRIHPKSGVVGCFPPPYVTHEECGLKSFDRIQYLRRRDRVQEKTELDVGKSLPELNLCRSCYIMFRGPRNRMYDMRKSALLVPAKRTNEKPKHIGIDIHCRAFDLFCGIELGG